MVEVLVRDNPDVAEGEVLVRLDSRDFAAKAEQARAALREAELNLEPAPVRAPAAGRVTRPTVEVGQSVQPGQPLLALVDLTRVWVVANCTETQVTHVRPGPPATLTVDTHPGLVLRARVDSMQSGMGARFSLLPPGNADHPGAMRRRPVP